MKEIPLSQGKVALVDDEDYERINQYKWSASKSHRTFYATRTIYLNGKKQRGQLMHRCIMNAPTGVEVNHWDHDGLNNQKYNLILVTFLQNKLYIQKHLTWKGKTPSSKYKGVTWHKRTKKWRSQITINKKVHHLGYFDEEVEAAKAYDEAAFLHRGTFAKLNFQLKR